MVFIERRKEIKSSQPDGSWWLSVKQSNHLLQDRNDQTDRNLGVALSQTERPLDKRFNKWYNVSVNNQERKGVYLIMKQEIIVRGKNTICKVLGADGNVYCGVAKCNSTDKFDYNVGAKIAIDRANIDRADGEKIALRQEIKELKELIAEKEREIKKLNVEIASRVNHLEVYLEN